MDFTALNLKRPLDGLVDPDHPDVNAYPFFAEILSQLALLDEYTTIKPALLQLAAVYNGLATDSKRKETDVLLRARFFIQGMWKLNCDFLAQPNISNGAYLYQSFFQLLYHFHASCEDIEDRLGSIKLNEIPLPNEFKLNNPKFSCNFTLPQFDNYVEEFNSRRKKTENQAEKGGLFSQKVKSITTQLSKVNIPTSNPFDLLRDNDELNSSEKTVKSSKKPKKPKKNLKSDDKNVKINSKKQKLDIQGEAPKAPPTIQSNFSKIVTPPPQASNVKSNVPNSATVIKNRVNNVKSSTPAPPKGDLIYFKPIDNWRTLVNDLFTTIKAKPLLKTTGDFIRITATSIDQLNTIRKFFSDRNVPYYGKNPSSIRPLKVLINGLPRDTLSTNIKSELINLGFDIISVAQQRNLMNKSPLSKFVVNLNTKEKFEEIYNITSMFGFEIEITSFRNSLKVKQCYRCLRFSHHSDTCKLPPRCLKCAGDHSTHSCPSKFVNTPKCANCNQGHTANFSGCPANPHNIRLARRFPSKIDTPQTVQISSPPEPLPQLAPLPSSLANFPPLPSKTPVTSTNIPSLNPIPNMKGTLELLNQIGDALERITSYCDRLKIPDLKTFVEIFSDVIPPNFLKSTETPINPIANDIPLPKEIPMQTNEIIENNLDIPNNPLKTPSKSNSPTKIQSVPLSPASSVASTFSAPGSLSFDPRVKKEFYDLFFAQINKPPRG